jgi:hypothetical protein
VPGLQIPPKEPIRRADAIAAVSRYRPDVRRLIALLVLVSMGLAVLGSTLIQPIAVDSAGTCPPGDFRSSQRTITEQTAALSAQDFRTARSFSSQRFQTNVSEEQFIGIIAGQYDFLLRSPAITFDRCDRITANELRIAASFLIGGVGTQLEYVMVYETDGWYVNAAENTQARRLQA